ncbi:hypothetical protein AB6A40_000550 [Gnathostoma spinigerum]|uniref:Cyclin N-terminal domain-containing protein n=1 Tax=Gnathostoma spinigerum TaxID=75299 RepID=A0ABD6E909_9BILA
MGLLPLAALHQDETDFIEKLGILMKIEAERRHKLEQSDLSEVQKYMLLPEFSIITTVYALSKYHTFRSYHDGPTLIAFKECIWFSVAAICSREDRTSLRRLYSILRGMKGVADVDVKDKDLSQQLEQNKKLWNVCNLGLLLLSRRKGVQASAYFQPALFSKFFFESSITEVADELSLPKEVISSEKSEKVTGSGQQPEKRKLTVIGEETDSIQIQERRTVYSDINFGQGRAGKDRNDPSWSLMDTKRLRGFSTDF